MNYHYYPAFMDLRGKNCVVIGGGKIAERKVLSLLRCGANVTVISPFVTVVLAEYSGRRRIRHIKRNYRKGDLGEAFLVIAATSDEEVNREVSLEAPCLLNVVDAPELANFIVPSVVKRGPLAFAVSTSGASPALAKSIRKELELLYDKEFGIFVDFLGRQRKNVLRGIADEQTRKRIIKQISGPGIIKKLRKEGLEKTKNSILKRIKEAKG
ncbi:MAG: bifunctional precorrin-2 dehydrogenase/sirohydrochlorin ferrochelatase [Nitrospirae bacterium]|nr:bifunctional precorrin-2 dehydrogenase/sirohydrochlorin ferrochelatase [Nitrospirota bacterium]